MPIGRSSWKWGAIHSLGPRSNIWESLTAIENLNSIDAVRSLDSAPIHWCTSRFIHAGAIALSG